LPLTFNPIPTTHVLLPECAAKRALRLHTRAQIYEAIRFGTVLENVVFTERSRDVDFHDCSLTENTRAAYPIQFIQNARIPCVGPHPKNIIMLCCDAYGVLPPVSKLTPAQTMYVSTDAAHRRGVFHTAALSLTRMNTTRSQFVCGCAAKVPLRVRVYGEGGGHRAGCDRAAGHVQRVLRRGVSRDASVQVRGAVG
jgi:hypothetical protein